MMRDEITVQIETV